MTLDESALGLHNLRAVGAGMALARLQRGLLVLASALLLLQLTTTIRIAWHSSAAESSFHEGASNRLSHLAEWKVSPLQSPLSSTTLQSDNFDLPVWLEDYFEWHKKARQRLDESNWQDQKYLLISCVHGHRKCAGAADRLRSIPVALVLAAQSKRILLIYWNRPAPLESFLAPGPALDWTVPEWLVPRINATEPRPVFWLSDNGGSRKILDVNRTLDTVVRMKNFRSFEYYDEHRQPTDPTLEQAYSSIWRRMFVPSPPVKALIDEQRTSLGLTQAYTGIHVRSLYRSNRTNDRQEENAIRCAQRLSNHSAAYYFASDASATTQNAIQYGREHAVPIVGRVYKQEPMHLDRGREFLAKSNDWQNRTAEDFYDVFVDLYLLAGASCVSYGVGSYGSWASLIGGHHSTCSIQHHKETCYL